MSSVLVEYSQAVDDAYEMPVAAIHEEICIMNADEALVADPWAPKNDAQTARYAALVEFLGGCLGERIPGKYVL